MGSPKNSITAQNADITRDLMRLASGFSAGGTRFVLEAAMIDVRVKMGITTGGLVESCSLASPCLSRITSSYFVRMRKSYVRTETVRLSVQVAEFRQSNIFKIDLLNP